MIQKLPLGVSNYRQFFLTVFLVLIISTVFLICLSHVYPYKLNYTKSKNYESLSLESLGRISETIVTTDSVVTTGRNPRCSYYDCFNIYKCGHQGSSKILVYVYPIKKYVDDKGVPVGILLTKEYYLILKTVLESEYFTSNPDEACVFIPSIDTLNQNRFRTKEVSQALWMLPFWNGGENHLIWNMIPGSSPDYNTVVDLSLGSAMVAGAGFDTWTYRIGFDISLPLFSIKASFIHPKGKHHKRKWLVISAQTNIHADYVAELEQIASSNPDFLLLGSCLGDQHSNNSLRCSSDNQMKYSYPHVLQRGVFCMVIRGARLAQPALLESLAAGCIPVVVADTIVLPFTDVIDWNRAAVIVGEGDLSSVMTAIGRVSTKRRAELSEQGRWIYSRYFSSIEAITRTTLDILNYRVYPHTAPTYDYWNIPPNENAVGSPLFLPLTAPRWQGFTAVILTYDRVSSLFALVQKLAQVPSLAKLLVVWNNQRKSPPPASQWPKVQKPIQVIQTKENKLSNRFYPYDEIETEAILSIDDDIVMLTSDELEFGYEVWREFPDRIVGFPSRTHAWNNVTHSWKYESEWVNHVSLVLTGAAFIHKYWNYMYTTAMPGDIKEWVDDHMNCEDIAMNFLVANITGKAPIKVTPRKKFKCPECTNTEMLSADLNHMVERSHCIDRFTSVYGTMPLRSVEFRADPVLYKDPFPQKLKRFNNIGVL